MQYDEAFAAAGMLGKAQYIVIAMTFLMSTYTGWQCVIPVFVSVSVPFKCVQTSLEPNDTTSIPPSSFDSICVANCQKYAYASTPSSIISTFDLACGTKNQLLATLSNSAFWIACLISCFIMGYLGDRFGRRPMNLLSMFFYCVFSSAGIISPNVWFYIASRFGAGFNHGGFMMLSFLIMTEIIDKKRLADFGMFTWVWFPVGEALASAMGVVFKNSWKHQLMAVSFALIPLFILYFLFVPESPLWLYSKRKTAQSEHILQRIARLNNKNPSKIVLTRKFNKKRNQTTNLVIISRQVTSEYESVIISTECDASDDNQRLIDKPVDRKLDSPVNIIDLYKTPPASLKSIGQISNWFTASLAFYGLTYGAGKIGSNIYINSALLSVVEIPSPLLCYAMKYFGRKRTYFVSMLISAAACIATPFTKDVAHRYVEIGLALLGKCLATGAFNILFIYGPELYPTLLRGTDILHCAAAAKIGTIIAPFIITLHYGPYDSASYLIIGVSVILSSILLLLWVPET